MVRAPIDRSSPRIPVVLTLKQTETMPLSLSRLALSVPTRKPDSGIVLRDLSLSIGEGECLGIVGEEAAGKSMLIKAVSGLLPPSARVTAGELSFSLPNEGTAQESERNWWQRSRGSWRRLRRTRLVVFEGEPSFAWNPRLTIRQHLEESLRLSGQGRDRK